MPAVVSSLPPDSNIPHLQVEWMAGKVVRLHLAHRAMGGGKPSRLRLLFYAHRADYRCVLRAYSNDFPRYFKSRAVWDVRQVRDNEGKVIDENFPQILSKIGVSSESLQEVRRALLGVIEDPAGTGGRARLGEVKIAGKTGTAQVVRMKVLEAAEESKEVPYEFRDHAWFVAFAPYQEPEVAVALIVEHGGHGGTTAAPMVKKLIEAYNRFYPMNPVQEATVPFPMRQAARP